MRWRALARWLARRLRPTGTVSAAWRLSFLAVAIGLAAGAASLLLRFAIEWVSLFWTGAREWERADALPWPVILFAPMIGGLLAGMLMKRLYPKGGLRGVPGVLADLIERGGRIDRRQYLSEGLGAPIAIGSGIALGREGPSVAVGAAIASEFARRLRLAEAQTRTLIGCGAAAGIAASFNTPIAGVLFAVEAILADYAISTFSPIVISAVLATILTRAWVGDFPAFLVPEYHLVSAWEILAHLVIGLLCGLVAALWIRLLKPARDRLARLAPDPRLRGLLGGMLIGLVGLAVPHALSIGYGVVEDVMLERVQPVVLGQVLPIAAFLGVLFLAKLVAVLVSTGAGLPGGLLGPALFLGSLIGALVGVGAHALAPIWTESYGAYALVGAAALTAAALQAPISTMLIAFEMTADYHIMLPVMAASIVATLIARGFTQLSLFTEPVAARGIEPELGAERAWLRSVSVARIPWRQAPKVHENASLAEVKEAYVRAGVGIVIVVDDDDRMVGIVTFADLQDHLLDPSRDASLKARDVCNRHVRTIREDGTLLEAVRVFDREGFEQMPVVSRKDPRRVLGVLSRHAVFATYNRLIVLHGEQT